MTKLAQKRNKFTPKIFGVYINAKQVSTKKVLHRRSWSRSEAVRIWQQSQNFWKTQIKLNGYTQKNKKVMVTMGRDGVTKKMKVH